MRIFILFFCIVSCVLLGCKDLDNNLLSNSLIRFNMYASNYTNDFVSLSKNLQPSLNGMSFSWKDNDVVAVFSNAKGLTNFIIDNESISDDGLSAMFNGSGFALTPNSNYYAFYPYSSVVSSLDKSAIYVTYNGQNIVNENNFDNLSKFDYMYAKSMADNNGKAVFNYNHLGSVVEFKIKVPKSATYTKLSIGLHGDSREKFLVDGIVDLTSDLVGIASNSDIHNQIVTFNSGRGIYKDEGTVLKVYVMMASQNVANEQLIVRLFDDNDKYYSALVSGYNMKSGYTYHYPVLFDSNGSLGNGIGFPDDKVYNPQCLSVYEDPQRLVYEGLCVDDNILYAVGNFGLRKIDYSNEYYPSLISSVSLSELSGLSDMKAKSIVVNDDYLYITIRQNSSGISENRKPLSRFRFESQIVDYSIFNNNSLSNNININNCFEALKINSMDCAQIFKKCYIYKAHFQNGIYLNTINLQGVDGRSSVIFREEFKTKNEALSALNKEYYNNSNDYCRIDWSKVPEGGFVAQNVIFSKPGEFDLYESSGDVSISNNPFPAPSFGLNSLKLQSHSSNSFNKSVLSSFLNSTQTNGELTLWLNLKQLESDHLLIPLLGYQSSSTLSLLVNQNNNYYHLGLQSSNKSIVGGQIFSYNEWIQLKITVSEESVKLFWRTKECASWSMILDYTNESIIFNSLNIGFETVGKAELYIDDFYYDSYNIDNSSYVNGQLVIVNKNDFNDRIIYHLDNKAIDVKIINNKLVVSMFYGFNVYDVSNPKQPILVYSFRVPNFKEFQQIGLFESVNQCYAIFCNYSQGYTIADISDLSDIKIVVENDYSNVLYNGQCLSGVIYNFDVAINYPYAYFTNSITKNYRNTDLDRRGILIIDLRNLQNFETNFSFIPSEFCSSINSGDPRPTKLALTNNNLVVNNGELGCSVFDISNGKSPIYMGNVSMPSKGTINCVYYDKIKQRVFFADDGLGGSSYPSKNVYLFNGL